VSHRCLCSGVNSAGGSGAVRTGANDPKRVCWIDNKKAGSQRSTHAARHDAMMLMIHMRRVTADAGHKRVRY